MGVFSLCVLVFFSSFSEALVTDICPPEAVDRYGKEKFKVYGEHCFLFVTRWREWYENAMRKCLRDGGLLAMPKTQGLLAFLLEELTHTYNVQEPVWIGMGDRLEEGKLRWEDGTEVEPGNLDASTHGWLAQLEDCVAFDPSDQLFHDYPCNGILGWGKKPFVCQYGETRYSWLDLGKIGKEASRPEWIGR